MPYEEYNYYAGEEIFESEVSSFIWQRLICMAQPVGHDSSPSTTRIQSRFVKTVLANHASCTKIRRLLFRSLHEVAVIFRKDINRLT